MQISRGRVKNRIGEREAINRRTWGGRLFPAILILLVLASCSSGCIRVVQKSLSDNRTGNEVAQREGGNNTMQTDTGKTGSPARTTPPVTPAEQLTQVGTSVAQAAAAMTTASSGSTSGNASTPAVVSEAAPIPVVTNDEIQHASRVNDTAAYSPEESRGDRIPVFSKKFTLRSNATGLLVNVTDGPLTVAFTIDTDYDCIENPDSCKSSLTESVTRPWCIITVRDNATETIVAQDGYGREFSGATSNRSMTVYGQGLYHITLEGSGLDVTLKITTGSSPLATNTTSVAGTTRTTLSPADYQRMRRGV